MGGFGSGRQGGMPTAEATASYVLDMSSFTRGGLAAGLFGTATVCFGGGEFPIEITLDTRSERDAYMQFIHRTRDSRREENVTYRVDLITTRPYYGGQRWWFVCPRTGRRAAKLCLPNGGWYFWSRRGYRLGYACQREAKIDRLMRKARKLHHQLGGRPGEQYDVAPPKPKWMRWRTYERRYAKWERVSERADSEFCLRAARLLKLYA
jgi:hypothetical protein